MLRHLLWNSPNMNVTWTVDQSTLVQVMAWCCQATSHYLSQCWPRSLSPYGVTRPQLVKQILSIQSMLWCGISVRCPSRKEALLHGLTFSGIINGIQSLIKIKHLPGIQIPIIKIRELWDCITLMMGIISILEVGIFWLIHSANTPRIDFTIESTPFLNEIKVILLLSFNDKMTMFYEFNFWYTQLMHFLVKNSAWISIHSILYICEKHMLTYISFLFGNSIKQM